MLIRKDSISQASVNEHVPSHWDNLDEGRGLCLSDWEVAYERKQAELADRPVAAFWSNTVKSERKD